MQRVEWAVLLAVAALTVCFVIPAAQAQEPPPPPSDQPAPPATQPPPQNNRYSHAYDFLIIGTVFTSQGYAFPGVELKIRRSSEKKFRWDSYTNSRGEFAVRVPQGTDYEMVVHVKGFLDQTRTLDAKSGLGEARLVFRMEPGTDSKK